LFSGGTFCFQATMLLQESMNVHSNTKVGGSLALNDMFKSEGHTVVISVTTSLRAAAPIP